MIEIFKSVREDIAVVFERDPAARSRLEVLLCYPGLHALWAYRLSHWLWQKRLYCLGRMLSQVARFCTGIEIHPGARIGSRLFIDHGMGVIIGETSALGDDVTMYQGVTLGGTGKEKGKRHPTIGDKVVIGAGAKVLGNIAVGDNCRIGAGSVVLRDVPENSTVVGVPARIVYKDGRRVPIADPKDIGDPVFDAVASLTCRLQQLETQLCRFRMAAQNESDHSPKPHIQCGVSAKPNSPNLSIIDETRWTARFHELEGRGHPEIGQNGGSGEQPR
jgi:serine O-acetyltransferase